MTRVYEFHHPIVWGDDFTLRTLERMAAIVNQSLRMPFVVESAGQIVRDVPGHDDAACAVRLREWLLTYVQFLPDPLIDGDVLRAPDYALQLIQRFGVARIDCDDCAMLAAALGKSIGLPARFLVMGFPEYRHVYAELLTSNGWIDMDVTESEQRRNTALTIVTRLLPWPV